VRKAFAYGSPPLDFPIEGSKEDIRSFTPQEPRHWNNAKLSSRLALEPRY
jgi:predicted Zn-dependent peptidase